jgi:TonB family protein
MRLSFPSFFMSFFIGLVLSIQLTGSADAQPKPAVMEYGSTPTRIDSSATAATSSDFGGYLSAVQSKVAQKAPQKFIGQVIITFQISKNGSVSEIKLTKSSGIPQIDDAAQAAVKSSAPFSALPTDAGSSAGIQFSFDGNSKGTTSNAIRLH